MPPEFLSTPSARRATIVAVHHAQRNPISIHALREEGDLYPCRYIRQGCAISIHALREEGDISPVMIPLFLSNFYPRPPRGGRPVDPLMFTVVPLFLSTPSARRATCLLTLYGSKEGISIHALREEGDRTPSKS